MQMQLQHALASIGFWLNHLHRETSVDQRYGLDVSKLLPYGTTVAASVRSDWSRSEFGNLTNSGVSFQMTQPLLRGFGPTSTQLHLTNARRNLVSSDRNLELSRQRLAVEVVAGYYNILRQRGLVDVAEGALERSKELLRASEARLKVGLASKLDVFRAELQLSQAEEGVIIRQEALELALDDFKFKLGLDLTDEIVLEMVEPEYQPLATDLEELTRLALDNRVEVLEEKDRIADARRSLSISKQNLLPQLKIGHTEKQIFQIHKMASG